LSDFDDADVSLRDYRILDANASLGDQLIATAEVA